MQDAFDLTGKIALVTGSSRGIGAALVRHLSQRGARCAVNYVEDDAGRNAADAQKVADEIHAAVIQCDVGDPAQVEEMFQRLRADLGGLDILINNAGILHDRTLAKMSAAEWDSVLRVNLTGAFHCIHYAIPLLRDGGRIVNIASVNALVGLFGSANYAAAKAGLLALTKSAARELARRQITVNAIAPGFVDTEMTRHMSAETSQEFIRQIPLGRFATPDDIAHAAIYLCSPAAAYITGQILHVNGGYWMG